LEDKVERTEVSSSRSIEEVYENRWRKGLDGFDKTDVTYLKHKGPNKIFSCCLNSKFS
jgi:hypothetical protein